MQAKPCRNWQQGHCRFGAACAFRHDGPPGGGGGGGAGKGPGGLQLSNFFQTECKLGDDCRDVACRDHENDDDHLKGMPGGGKPKGFGWKGGCGGKGKKGRGAPRPMFQNLTWNAGKGPGDQPSAVPSIKAATGPYLGKGSELLKVWSMPEDMGHSDGITSAVVMGDRVCTGGADGQLLLWRGNQANGGLELALDSEVALDGAITALLFHAASKWLFCGLSSGAIKAFRQEPLAQASMEGHGAAVAALAVHDAAPAVLSGSADGTVRVWTYDASGSFACAATLPIPTGPVSSLLVQSNSSLWVGAATGITCVNLHTMQVAGNIESPKPVVRLVLYKDAVLAAFADGIVKVFDSGGTEKFRHGPLGEHDTNTAVGLLQHPFDGQDLLMCGQAVGYVTVYRLPDFQPRGTLNTGYEGEVSSILDMGSGVFATCGMSGDTVLWRWEDRRNGGVQ